ncbi:MAG: hypothetical protein WCG75_11840, partial [Armatimonadota bacterium]
GQRADLEFTFYRKVFALCMIMLSAAIAFPLLIQQNSASSLILGQSEGSLALSNKAKSELQAKAKAIMPSIQMDDMVIRSHRFSNSYLNELTKVVNSAPSEIFFEQLTTEVNQGECTIKVLANAANPDVGREFVDNASKGANVLSATQTSVRQSPLSKNSIKFDFIKRVSL